MAGKRKRYYRGSKRRNILPAAVAGAAGTAALTAALPGYYRDAQGVLRDAKGQVSKFASRFRRNPEDIDFLNEMAPYVSRGHVGFTDDGLEEFVRDGHLYHAFANTPVFNDGYRMGTPVESLETLSQENPAKFDRCVRAVQAHSRQTGYPANAYAVCTAAGTRNVRRRNPAEAADSLYEAFHGTPPQETLEIVETEHFHSHLAGLADLVSLIIYMEAGTRKGQLYHLIAPDPEKAQPEQIIRLTSNEAGTQIYTVGGDQSLDLHELGFRDSFTVRHDGDSYEATDIKDLMVLGEVRKLTYRTQKAFDQFELVDYFHKLGEDTKSRPTLLFDNLNQRLKFAGGEYTIHFRGIVN